MRPHAATLNNDGTVTHQLDLGRFDLGAAVTAEVQNPSNGAALYTVPIGKTFTGRVTINCHTDGYVRVSAATGGVLAGVGASSLATAIAPCEVDLVVAGGGTGNAITIPTSGNNYGSIQLVGYVK